VRRALVLAVLLVAVVIAADRVIAQSQSNGNGARPASAVPRTPWGHPDLQGTWDYRTITPLERPQQYGTREYLTDAEVKALEERAAKRMDEPPPDDAPAGTVHPTYWTDPGRFVDEDRRTSLIIDPPDGRIPALVNAAAGGGRGRGAGAGGGAARQGGRADSWTDRSLLERCITWGIPTASLPGLYNNNIQIVQSPDSVVIVHEMVHDARVIPLDGRARVTSGLEQRHYLGESRGWWEGDTLVVETTNFGWRTSYRGANVNLKLTERYRRVNADRVELRLTVEDPTVWTKPWTVRLAMRPSEGPLVEYACHEGNYGLRNILEVARDEEKAAAGQK
jgi:hypothetical protein